VVAHAHEVPEEPRAEVFESESEAGDAEPLTGGAADEDVDPFECAGVELGDVGVDGAAEPPFEQRPSPWVDLARPGGSVSGAVESKIEASCSAA
jgi:hypothetical protein